MKTYTNGVKQINYGYNAENLRIYKIVNGEFTGYVWNGSSLAAETSDNAVTSTYTYGADGITTAQINGTTNIYLKNVHGDVVGTTDANGILQKSYRYDAFGNEQNPDENDPNPFRYCGEYFDSETSQIYLRNRYYSPNIGRFITEDPIRDGLNWYVYASNNAIRRKDSTGLDDYDDVLEYLEYLKVARKTLENSSPRSNEFRRTYKRVLDYKNKIQNFTVYVEDWNNLRTEVLYSIVNGDNNTVEKIQYAIDRVKEEKNKNVVEHLKTDITFTAGLTTTIAVLLKGGAKLLKGSSISVSPFNFGPSALQHMSEAGRFVPVQILQEAIRSGRAEPDPRGTNAIMYYIDMLRNGKLYTLEVLYDKATNTIKHFMYYPKK